REDDDVFIRVEIPALNLSEKSEEFKIEKYGDKDRETEIFYLTIPKYTPYGYYDIKASVVYEDGEDSEFKELIITSTDAGQTKTEVEEGNMISLNSGTGGTPLILGSSSGSGGASTTTTSGSASSGNTLVLGSGNSQTLHAKSSKSMRNLLKGSDSVSLGVNEQITKEYNPNVKVEFDGEGKKTFRINTNQWVLLAVVLGLLIIIILVLITFLRRNR
ncbi:MAG: hypothetical protein NTZ83_03330, partial [Candidatus Pacearchaeota archaeon]|nr:hypothetical protein [Candidatus Pacearchaeota archaeon]